ncbi:hypothetical protein K1719_038821 [Acacia pycnantha]|nr:hypothetical protein K1719_038821 [Acacia pycnantha]
MAVEVTGFEMVQGPVENGSEGDKSVLLDKEVSKKNQARFHITESLKAKRVELISQVKTLRERRMGNIGVLWVRKEKKLNPSNKHLASCVLPTGGRGGLCSSEEELNDMIYGLKYCIQHESIPSSEEKLLLKEIKQLEGTREKVIANV